MPQSRIDLDASSQKIVLTGTLRVLRVNSVPHLLLSLGAGVTPAQGSLKPTVGFISIKFFDFSFYVNIDAMPVGRTNLPAGFIECASASSFCLNASISAACFASNAAASRARLRSNASRSARRRL